MPQHYGQGGRDGRPHGGGGRHDPGPSPELVGLLKNAKPMRYFSDDKRTALRADLMDEEAQQIAQDLAGLASSQLRRFYGEAMALRRRVETNPDMPNDEIRAQLALLKAKAAYTFGREKNNQKRDALRALVRFFRDHAASVKDRQDYGAFARHFEAVIAFHRFFAKDKN